MRKRTAPIGITDCVKLIGTQVSEVSDMPPSTVRTVNPAQASRMKNPAVIASASSTAHLRVGIGIDSRTLSKPMWRRRSTARAEP